MPDVSDPRYRAVLAPFEANIATTSAAMESVRQRAREREVAREKEQAELAARYEKEKQERAAAAEKVKSEDTSAAAAEPAKPNAWAEPRPRQDTVMRIGVFDDEEPPLVRAGEPAPSSPAPEPPEPETVTVTRTPAPAASDATSEPAPESTSGPSRPYGKHARPDDDEDFDAGSWLRG